MTLAEQSITHLMQKLTPDRQREVRDFIEFLLVKQTHTSPESHWPIDYFSRVIGSLPDFPDSDDTSGGIDPSLDDSDDTLRF